MKKVEGKIHLFPSFLVKLRRLFHQVKECISVRRIHRVNVNESLELPLESKNSVSIKARELVRLVENEKKSAVRVHIYFIYFLRWLLIFAQIKAEVTYYTRKVPIRSLLFRFQEN